MSEACKPAAGNKLGTCAAVCYCADARLECACLGGTEKGRVQVRAKVLYGSGTAIANLRAKEKTTGRPNF